MRLAVVVASSYPKSSAHPRLPVAEVDGRRMSERLAEEDARFVVEELSADRRLEAELSTQVDRALGARGMTTLLFYFSGYAELTEEGDALIALDTSRGDTLSLSKVRQLLSPLDEAFVVLDLVHAPDEDDPTLSATYVAAARDAFVPKQSGIGVLLAARPSDRSSRVPSPLTHLLLRSLERVTPSSGGRRAEAVTVRAAYEAMREDRELFHELPAAGHFMGRRDFAILLPPNVVVSDVMSRSEPPPRSVRPSVRPVSEAPSPAESTAEGDALAAEGRHEAAIDAYKRALFLSGSTKGPERAELYYRLGRAKRALGSDAEAVHNFDKALAALPLHDGAFRAAREILTAQKDFAHLEKLHRRRLELAADDETRIRELTAIAQAWQDQAGDDKRALPALEQWLEIRPDPAAYERLIGALDRLARPAAAIAARRKLADIHTDPVLRGQVLTDAARIAQSALPNKNEAIELARQALEADAGALASLEVAATLLGKQRRWAELAAVYESVLERMHDAPVAWDLARRLGMLYRDELDAAEPAKRAFSRALDHDPSDVELRFWLAELAQAERDYPAAADQMRLAARFAPRDAEVYRRALWLFEKTGEADATWCAAIALDQLDEADVNESLLAEAHRPEGLPAVRAALVAGDWEAGLLHPERDQELEQLLSLVSDAAVELAADRLRAAKRLPTPDPATRQDAERGTATVARSLVWTARLLSIEIPALHVVAEVPGGILTLPTRERTLLVARSLASGVDLPELAFLWARQLWFHRPEHFVLLAYPSLAELATLLLAALAAGGRESDAVDDEVRALADALAERLDDDQRRGLEQRAASMQTRGLRRRLVDWSRGVHLRAARPGLLACGDLARAAEFVRRAPPSGGVEPEAQIDDLRAFSIGREHARARAQIGVALRG